MRDFVSSDEGENRDAERCAYYECDRCGFRVKEFETGRTEIPDGDEWDQFCE